MPRGATTSAPLWPSTAIPSWSVPLGSTLDAFMRDARRTLESAEEFDSSRFFLEALLATTTYETFLGLMMTEARRVKDKRDSKLDTIDEDEEKGSHK